MKNKNPLKGRRPDRDLETLFEILEDIAETGEDIECIGYNGMTVLHYAAFDAKFDRVDLYDPIIERLLELGAKKDLKDGDGKIPFDYLDTTEQVTNYGKRLIPDSGLVFNSEYLFSALQPKLSEEDGESNASLSALKLIPNPVLYEDSLQGQSNPIHLATFWGNLSAIRYLAQSGYDLDKKAKDRDYPLNIAAERGLVETVHILIELGADVNCVGQRRNTPLHNAAKSDQKTNSSRIVKLLISAGADWKSYALDYGETPLHSAVSSNNLNCVKALIDAGVDKGVLDKKGLTALELAREDDYEEAISILSD